MSRAAKFTLVISLFLSSSSFALSPGADDLITERIKTFVEEVNAVSVNVALVRDGQIIYKEAYGKANVEKRIAATTKHRYMIGSVSKLFT